MQSLELIPRYPLDRGKDLVLLEADMSTKQVRDLAHRRRLRIAGLGFTGQSVNESVDPDVFGKDPTYAGIKAS